MKKLKLEELGRMDVAAFKAASKTPIIIVLDNIRSMNNIGSVFRSADAFAVEAIGSVMVNQRFRDLIFLMFTIYRLP
jgi:tRNA G18 (ribose-2'-O)-methylase SpoU